MDRPNVTSAGRFWIVVAYFMGDTSAKVSIISE